MELLVGVTLNFRKDSTLVGQATWESRVGPTLASLAASKKDPVLENQVGRAMATKQILRAGNFRKKQE